MITRRTLLAALLSTIFAVGVFAAFLAEGGATSPPAVAALSDFEDPALASHAVKFTYLGPQTAPVPATVLLAPGDALDMSRFVPFRNASVTYANDELTDAETGQPVVTTATLASKEFRDLVSGLQTIPAVTFGPAVKDVPLLSLTLVAVRAGKEIGFESTVGRHQAWQVITAALVALQPSNTAAQAALSDVLADVCGPFDEDDEGIPDGCDPSPVDLDADLDGCDDPEELGAEPGQGGLRNPTYFWDFYDTPNASNARDKTINVLDDIIGVAGRFGATGDSTADPLAGPIPPAPAYHTAFDRGVEIGPNPWNVAPADGAINVLDDILGVAQQFGHSCATP